MCAGNFIQKQRCRDRAINDFLSWSRHLLVPLLFHDVTSLHPLHFREMIFPLVPHTFLIWGKAPIKMECRYADDIQYALRWLLW